MGEERMAASELDRSGSCPWRAAVEGREATKMIRFAALRTHFDLCWLVLTVR
jgi:hypothetical protein